MYRLSYGTADKAMNKRMETGQHVITLLHLPTVHMSVKMYVCIHTHIHNAIYLLCISASKLLMLYEVFTISAFSCFGNHVPGYTEAHLGRVVSREACLSGKRTPIQPFAHKASSMVDSLEHTFFRGGFNTVNSSALYFPPPNSPASVFPKGC